MPLRVRFFGLRRGICASLLRPPEDTLQVKSDEQNKGHILWAAHKFWDSRQFEVWRDGSCGAHRPFPMRGHPGHLRLFRHLLERYIARVRSGHIGGICQQVTGRHTGHGISSMPTVDGPESVQRDPKVRSSSWLRGRTDRPQKGGRDVQQLQQSAESGSRAAYLLVIWRSTDGFIMRCWDITGLINGSISY